MRSTYTTRAVGNIIMSPVFFIANNTIVNNAPHRSGFNPSINRPVLEKYFTAKTAERAKNIMSVATVAILAPIKPKRGIRNKFKVIFNSKQEKANNAFNICLFAITIKLRNRTFGNIKRDVQIKMLKACAEFEYAGPYIMRMIS